MKGFSPTTTGIPVNETRHTFNGVSTIKKGDEGKAVTLDTSAEMTVKLAGADDVVLGQLEMIEIETTGEVIVGVLIMGGYRLACDPAENIAVGDTVVGKADGLVKSGGASTDLRFIVTETSTIPEGFVGVLKL